MVFKHWFQGLEVIALFLVAVALPCYFIGLWGTRMINELGNHPSRNDQIQASSGWKIFLVEIVSFILLVSLFIFLYNLQNEQPYKWIRSSIISLKLILPNDFFSIRKVACLQLYIMCLSGLI